METLINSSSKNEYYRESILTWIPLILLEFCTLFLSIVQNSLYRYLKVFTILLFVFVFFVQTKKFDKKRLPLWIVSGIALISYIFCGDTLLLYFAVVMCCFTGADYKKVAKIDLICKSIFIPAIIVLSLLKVIPTYNDVVAGRTRYSLGFYNVNNLFFYVFVLVTDIAVVAGKKINFFHLLLMLAIGITFGEITYCRTGMIMTIFMVLFLFLDKYCKITKLKIVRFGLIYGFFIFLILSFVGIYLYNQGNEFIKMLDLAFTKRIRFSAEIFDLYGLSFLGQPVTLITGLESSQSGVRALSTDNNYVYFMMAYGVVFTLALGIVFVMAQKRLIRYDYSFLAIVLFVFFVYAIMEKILVSVERNSLLIVLVPIFSSAFSGETMKAKENEIKTNMLLVSASRQTVSTK